MQMIGEGWQAEKWNVCADGNGGGDDSGIRMVLVRRSQFRAFNAWLSKKIKKEMEILVIIHRRITE